MKRRLTKAEAQRQHAEAEAAQVRGGLEGQVAGQKQTIDDLQKELGALVEQVREIRGCFSTDLARVYGRVVEQAWAERFCQDCMKAAF